MGSSSWSASYYTDRASLRSSSGFAGVTTPYTNAIHKGTTAKKTHDKLDPKGVNMRESRDSKEHPESLAIAVLFDVTGSMSKIPAVLQTKLGALMQLLLKKGYVEHPQILFGAIGDANSDQCSIQIGQFESGCEMDTDLENIFLEAGGGGSTHESYELGAYFMARHTSIDCLEKRNQKGYLFFIADEQPYKAVRATQVNSIFGDTIQADIPTEEIFKELQEKYEVFCLYPKEAGYYSDKKLRQKWVDLLGQNVIYLEKADDVAETIAMTIGINQGLVDLDGATSDLVDMGVSKSTASSVSTALSPFVKGRDLTKASSIDGLVEIEDNAVSGISRL